MYIILILILNILIINFRKLLEKLSLQRKIILKLEREVCILNSALEYLKEVHISLVRNSYVFQILYKKR